MSNPEFNPDTSASQEWGGLSLGQIYANIMLRNNEIAEELGVDGYRVQPSPNTHMKIEAPNNGNSLALSVGGRPLLIGHYDPVVRGYTLYPELVEMIEEPLLLPGIENARNEAIEKMNTYIHVVEPRINYDHHAVGNIHYQQNKLLRNSGLGEHIAISHSYNTAINPTSRIEIDKHTLMTLCLRTADYGVEGKAPARIPAIRYVGSYFSTNGAKHRHEAKYVDLGTRTEGEEMSFGLFPRVRDYISPEQLAFLIELAKMLHEEGSKIPDFDFEQVGVALRKGQRLEVPTFSEDI